MTQFTPPGAPTPPTPPPPPPGAGLGITRPGAPTTGVSTPQPRRRDVRVTAVVAFMVLAGALIGAGVIYDVLSGTFAGPFEAAGAGDTGSMHPAEVISGMCVAGIGEGEEVAQVEVVPCDEPHDAIVVSLLPFFDDEWPGVEALTERATTRCVSDAAQYGADAWTAWLPTEDSWDRNDRAVACIALG